MKPPLPRRNTSCAYLLFRRLFWIRKDTLATIQNSCKTKSHNLQWGYKTLGRGIIRRNPFTWLDPRGLLIIVKHTYEGSVFLLTEKKGKKLSEWTSRDNICVYPQKQPVNPKTADARWESWRHRSNIWLSHKRIGVTINIFLPLVAWFRKSNLSGWI